MPMVNPRTRNQKDHAVTLTPKSLEPRRYEALVTSNRISAADLKAALTEAANGSSDLETILIDNYRVAAPDLGAALSEYYQCPYIGFNERMVVDPALLKSLNLDYLKKNYWVPLKRELQVLDVLIDDPRDLDKGQDVRRAFPGLTVRFAVGLRRDILQFLQVAAGEEDTASYGRAESASDILGELVTEAQQEQQEQSEAAGVDENDSAIVRLANQIITEAYRVEASDIHIEPNALRRDTIVRFRVDGTCSEYMRIPPTYFRAIVSRLKIMANLDIAERRKGQDGKIRFSLRGGKEIELRVATVPTVGGNEDVVMRILASSGPLPLDQMNFSARNLRELLQIVQRPYGMILCVGPTGSGKTTTLHAVLGYLNQPERKIWTAEDPVEITQVGLRQVQVMPKIGWTFANVMRAFLRADPDVIMIGEMRDKETADIAIEASLTGHLMLSTLHTNSAPETVTRLLDLGCDPFNFADAMLGVM
ncbi:MAG: GspE/PulE family protein, partial [Nitrospiraceae bacterium]